MTVIRRCLLAALFAVAAPLGASAYPQSYGFVWAHLPTTGFYTPDAFYAYNNSGTPPHIIRNGTGQYSVVFPGLHASYGFSEGNVQVTARGTTADYCKLAGWSGDVVSVACFDAAGNPVDSQYTVLYVQPFGGVPNSHAFALADQPANPSYTPNAARSFNGDPITATRLGVGSYSMEWTGFSAASSGNVQVTAHGSGNARCRSAGWSSDTAFVACFDPSGAPVDSGYSILYWRDPSGPNGLAWAWADQPNNANYTPDASYSYSAGAGTITATRSSAGVYSMTWAGMSGIGINGGNIQVTAHGTNALCKVSSWGASAVGIRCFDTAGNPVDAQYNVLFLKPPKKPWMQTYAFAWAFSPSELSYPPYNYNHLAEGPSVTSTFANRSAPGAYSVSFFTFDGFTDGGNVQVTANGAAGEYCKVLSWTADTVNVRCFNAAGVATDTAFLVLYLKAPLQPTGLAYAWANDATAASYTPAANYSYNPSGGAITATRLGTGSYGMSWAGFGALATGGGHPQVTAYDGSNKRCQIASWASDTVSVRCYDSAGNPADSRYTIMYVRPDAVDDGLAFAWANEPASANYVPSEPFSFNSGSGTHAQRLGTGLYRIFFLDFVLGGLGDGLFAGNIQVNGYGTTDARCAVEDWDDGNFSFSAEVVVRCHDSAGAPVDTRYNVLYLRPLPAPEPGAVAMLASGVVLLGWLSRRRRRARA